MQAQLTALENLWLNAGHQVPEDIHAFTLDARDILAEGGAFQDIRIAAHELANQAPYNTLELVHIKTAIEAVRDQAYALEKQQQGITQAAHELWDSLEYAELSPLEQLQDKTQSFVEEIERSQLLDFPAYNGAGVSVVDQLEDSFMQLNEILEGTAGPAQNAQSREAVANGLNSAMTDLAEVLADPRTQAELTYAQATELAAIASKYQNMVDKTLSDEVVQAMPQKSSGFSIG